MKMASGWSMASGPSTERTGSGGRPALAGRDSRTRLAALLLLALGLWACDTSLEEPVGDFGDGDTGSVLPDATTPSDADGSGVPDSNGDVSDTPTEVDTAETPTADTPITDDVGDTPTDTSEPTIVEGLNACGGPNVLRYNSESAVPSDACGALGEGVLVCEGTRALRCVDQAPFNACGGRGILPVELGEACGCGGRWVCGADGDPKCSQSFGLNGCGGCGPLDGSPWSPCGAIGNDPESPSAERWVCAEPDRVVCANSPENACGSPGNLTWQGTPALPGGPCETPCGPGVLQCGVDADALDCVPVGDTPPENACGGCGALPAAQGEACGCFNSGTWQCESGGLRCIDSVPRDVCGNCTGSAVELGRRCDVVPNGIWLCEGPALSCLEPVEPQESNACGGLTELSADPGEACGDCLSGRWACTTRDSVSCEPDPDHERNECGGCAPLAGSVGMDCGECGSGSLVCANGNESLGCSGNNPNLLNECGGCSELGGLPGDDCGDCRALACVGGGLSCVLDPDCTP